MGISYKGIQITRSAKDGKLYYRLGGQCRGPFEHYSDVEEDMDEHVCDHDPENIYNLPSIRQSIEEDRK
jgi:hypothetical protein